MSPLPDRIERRIDRSGCCWEWLGRLHQGYGYISVGKKQRRAHRIVYESLVGPIPAGLELDHLCRNRACVNPDHLEPVTRRENLRRSPLVNTWRSALTHCKRGHEFTLENTYRDKFGHRHCRACAGVWRRKYRLQKAAA